MLQQQIVCTWYTVVDMHLGSQIQIGRAELNASKWNWTSLLIGQVARKLPIVHTTERQGWYSARLQGYFTYWPKQSVRSEGKVNFMKLAERSERKSSTNHLVGGRVNIPQNVLYLRERKTSRKHTIRPVCQETPRSGKKGVFVNTSERTVSFRELPIGKGA